MDGPFRYGDVRLTLRINQMRVHVRVCSGPEMLKMINRSFLAFGVKLREVAWSWSRNGGFRMDANETQLREQLRYHLTEATRVAAEIQALEQGDGVPHFDQIELPAHALGQRFSRAI